MFRIQDHGDTLPQAQKTCSPFSEVEFWAR
jgi:hypothetical protein